MVLHPAAHAIRAAVSFVTIPPVPTLLPAPPTSTSSSLMFSTTSIRLALGSVFGLDVYSPEKHKVCMGRQSEKIKINSPSTSVRRNSHCASDSAATCAESVSLSPNRSSSTATQSFSFTTGTTPMSKSALNVFRARTYCLRLERFSRVRSTCAHLTPMVLKMSS